MARLLIFLIPLALIGLAIWLPSLLPTAVLAFIGWTALSLAATAGVVVWCLSILSEGMRS